MEYKLIDYRESDLVRLDIKINGEDASPSLATPTNAPPFSYANVLQFAWPLLLTSLVQRGRIAGRDLYGRPWFRKNGDRHRAHVWKARAVDAYVRLAGVPCHCTSQFDVTVDE